MDDDLKYIIEEEKKLVRELEDSRRDARERVEAHRISASLLKKSEIERIASETGTMIQMKLEEIRSEMEKELDELRMRQERLIGDDRLKEKITGRLVSLILENRT